MIIPLADRKAYLATIPWVTILKRPKSCEGKRGTCKNPGYYRYRHIKDEFGWRPGTRTYCWNHMIHAGLHGTMTEDTRFGRWVDKHPPPWEAAK